MTTKIPWDRIGITLSGVCALHCLLLPVTISLLPIWPVFSEATEWMHALFLLLVLPTALFAARRSHFDRKITMILAGGVGFVSAGWFFGHLLSGHLPEVLLTITGSFLLISGHWKNYRHHRTCSRPGHRHHPVAEELLAEEAEETSSTKVEAGMQSAAGIQPHWTEEEKS